jgi:hypothetical protein
MYSLAQKNIEFVCGEKIDKFYRTNTSIRRSFAICFIEKSACTSRKKALGGNWRFIIGFILFL